MKIDSFRTIAFVFSISLFASCLGKGTLESTSKSTFKIEATLPTDAQTDVLRNASVRATFNQDIAPDTLTTDSFFVEANSVRLDATVTYSAAEKAAVLTTAVPFSASTEVFAHVTTTVKGASGDSLANEFIWSFQTGADLDTTAPTFSGITSATDNADGTATLSWTAATDDSTSASHMTYLLYDAGDLSTLLTSVTGKTSMKTLYVPSGAYTWTVRARDDAGNIDTNTASSAVNITVPSVSFASDVQPIFTTNCTFSSCHDSVSPQQGMDLTDAYTYTVNVTSNEKPSLHRIEPGDVYRSYLYLKIIGDPSISGLQMPRLLTPLTSNKIATIRNWILNGAPNN